MLGDSLIVQPKSNASEEFMKSYPLKIILPQQCSIPVRLGLMLVVIVLLALIPQRSFSQIFYSGTRNIVIQSPVSGVFFNPVFDLAGDTTHTWDNLAINLGFGSTFTLGGQTSYSLAPCVLAYESEFPYVERYAYGATPSGRFGSGTMVLWRYGTPSMDVGFFRNTSGYAYLHLGDFSDTEFYGWLQLSVSNYDLTTGIGPTITLIDWAFDLTPGNQLYMGEVPEPSIPSLGLMGASVFLAHFRYKKYKGKSEGYVRKVG